MLMTSLKAFNRQKYLLEKRGIGWGFLPLFSLFLLASLLLSFFPAPLSAQEVIHVPDRQLEAAVRQALNRPAGILSGEDFSRLLALDVPRLGITDLSGLEYAINLQSLNLYENSVEDLAPLKGLDRLQYLNLAGNRVSRSGPLQNLKGLEELNLSHNKLQEIDGLKNLTRLKRLQLEGNQIGSLAALESLRSLQSLSLSGKIADKSTASLSQLTRLQHLSLIGGQISDSSFLAGLKQLQTLDLRDNKIDKTEPLKGLTRLKQLNLANNRVEDLTPLGGMRQLEHLDLSCNRIKEITALVRLRNIQWLELQNNFLELEKGNPARRDMDKLLSAGAEVITNPQRLPIYRGNGLVIASKGSGGRLLRTPIENYFTLLNQSAGWRIKSFTVTHEGGKPLDRLRELGLRSTGSFAWQSITGGSTVGNQEDAFFTLDYRKASPVQLGLAIQIWPGYAGDPQRVFYISQVILENLETGDLYTVDLKRDLPPLPNTPAFTGTGAAAQDYLEKASPAKTDLQNILADALQQRITSLEVHYSGEALQMPGELEKMLENILAGDDYLRYSQHSRKISWTKQPGGDLLFGFRFNYLATREEENIVDSQVGRVLREILKPGLNAHQKTKAIHDYVVANVAYDLGYREHSAFSALIKGRAVCQGYALLMHKMLKEAGIPVRIITGRAGGEDHAWNMVNLEGNWYHLDATWDDPVPDTPGAVRYDYYNRTDAQMAPTHNWERGSYPTATSQYLLERIL